MPELRKDPVTGRWVIVASGRRERPTDFGAVAAPLIGRDPCPFCPGHEAMTPPEVMAVRDEGSAADGPGWQLRVVPNKYPALSTDGAPDLLRDGLLERLDGVGAHEVFVETPDHGRGLSRMSEEEIARTLSAYAERIRHHQRDPRFRYVLVFRNHGAAAGATLEHPHAQLIALPVVPDFVREELDGAARYFAEHRRCVFCDLLRQELDAGERLVHANGHVVALAPYASRFPFEVWLLPRAHESRFEETGEEVRAGLAAMLKWLTVRVDRAFGEPPYNLIVHTAPVSAAAGGSPDAQPYHWHVEFIPRLTRTAGFEWGSGFHINPVPPEEAADVLRRAGGAGKRG